MHDRRNLEIYDRIPLPKSLTIPQRSRLYSLEPIGIGTPFTESISSYLTRLAQEHCLPLKKLIMGEIAPVILGDCEASRRHRYQLEMLSKNVSSIFGNSDAKPAINGMRDMTRSLIDALGQLTLRQDLSYLSCLTYQEVIKDRSLFRSSKAWCPHCFQQQKQKKQTIYEPLLWSFKDVNYCLKHNSQLSDRCPHCNSPQKAIANNSRLGFCDKCNSWLGNDSRKINESDRHKITAIGELIAIAPLLDSSPNLPDLIRKLQLIHFCFEKIVGQDLNQFIVLGKIMEQLKITLAQHYNKPLNLIELLISTCNLAKISISQLFQEDFQTLSKILVNQLAINYRFK